MRVFYGAPGQPRYEGRWREDDVLVVPDFVCAEEDFSTYGDLARELGRIGVEHKGLDLEALPGVSGIVGKAAKYLGIGKEHRGVRLAWRLSEGEDEVVRDFGQVASVPAAGQNCIARLAFGCEVEMAFQRSGSEELLFFPQTNGALHAAGDAVWARWLAGVRAGSREDRSRLGRVTIIIFGRSALLEAESALAAAPSDARIGSKAMSGRLGPAPCPDRQRPDMRVIAVPKRRRYGRPVSHDDVIIVPEFCCAEDDWSIYYQLIKEMRECQAEGQRQAEWISWHEGAHLLSKNPTGSRTYQKVLDQISDYFAVAAKNQGTRFNWYRDGSDWKPFHHDSAAFNAQRAATQNCTIGISFGADRDLAFRHAKTGELLYFPQKNGMLFYFGRDANIVWQHGINALPREEQDGKGRISIILWGLCTTAVDEAGSPPMLSDESRGKGKGKGGYDGRQRQPCRDFARGRCSYGDKCRFSHDDAAGASGR